MTPKQRIALRVAFLLVIISGGLLTIMLKTTPAQASCSTCTGRFYGAGNQFITATNGSIWPQHTNNACGIADAIGLVNYLDLQNGIARKFTSGSGQTTMENANQTSGASQWGYAAPTNAWGGITNLSPDFGTDPRSVTYDTKHYLPSNYDVHDFIYHWQFAHTTAPSYSTQAKEATNPVGQTIGDVLCACHRVYQRWVTLRSGHGCVVNQRSQYALSGGYPGAGFSRLRRELNHQ